MKPTISLVIISLNEADRIARAIDSVPFADQVVVMDSGSTDGTCDLARAMGAVVIEADWPGHVMQKNRAFASVTTDYVLSLDADEALCSKAQASIQRLLQQPHANKAYRLARCSHWQGRPIRHGKWYPDRKIRLVPTGWGRWVGDDPHDRLAVDLPVVDLEGEILHWPYRSFEEHLHTIRNYSTIAAKTLQARGVKSHWWDVAFRPGLHFADAMIRKQAFRDGPEGVAIAGLGAGHTLLKWTKLWRNNRSR